MKRASILIIIILFGVPISFVLLPTSFFEQGARICLVKNILGIDCPGCGTIRAISSIFHFQFNNAYNYNRLIVIVFPLLAVAWVKYTLLELRALLPRNSIIEKINTMLSWI